MDSSKNITKKSHAFTLIELIVVITILTILSTIGFVSLTGYFAGTRDSVRLTDMNNIYGQLNLSLGMDGNLPLPDGYRTITLSGTTIIYQGYAGKTVLNAIKFEKGGRDPKDDIYYTYTVDRKRRQAQLMVYFEEYDTSKMSYVSPLMDKAFAANPTDYSGRKIGVLGKKIGVLVESGTLVPIQDTSSGTLDVATTSTGYMAYFDNTTTGNGNGAILGNAFLNNSVVYNTGVSVVVPTTTFSLSATSASTGTPVTISDTCTSHPTSYTSSNTAVATVSATTITTLTVGTTNITPVGGNCTDSVAKTLTVTAPPDPFASCTAAGMTFTGTTTYSGCTSPDIIICSGSGTGQIWAICNAGATTPWTTQTFASTTAVRDITVNTWAGGLYQWGNSTDVSYAGTTAGQVTCTNTPNGSASATFRTSCTDWCTPQSDDLWGNTTNTNTARQGPCATNYHVPTSVEWTSVITAITGKSSGWVTADADKFQNTLKLPAAGYRGGNGGSVVDQESAGGYYWSSSPVSTVATTQTFYPGTINSLVNNNRAAGLSVRCLKN